MNKKHCNYTTDTTGNKKETIQMHYVLSEQASH